MVLIMMTDAALDYALTLAFVIVISGVAAIAIISNKIEKSKKRHKK